MTKDEINVTLFDELATARERIAELEAEARFLLARLNDLEFSDLDDVYRDFCGHVEPSMARLSDLVK